MPATAMNRLLRGAIVGAMAVVLGSTSHVMACGEAPDAATLLIVLVAATLASSALMSTQVSMARIAGITVGGQVLLHHVLSVGAAAHQHGAAAPIDLASLQAGTEAAFTTTSAQMTLLHACTAVAVAWWLARGERILWTLISLLASPWTSALARLHEAFAPVRAALSSQRALPSAFEPPRLRQQVWATSTCDRGPPTGRPIRRLAPA